MNKYFASLAAFALLGFALITPKVLGHDSIPGKPQTRPIALLGGTIYPVGEPPIENGALVFDKGKIVALGKADEVTIPAEAERIDVHGKRIYPSLFDAHTHLGLVEIPSVRATVDERETGIINPNVEAIKAVHPESELIPVTRSNGVLLALSAPGGPLLAGQSSVIQLDGWTNDDMALKNRLAMHLTWPHMVPLRDWRNPAPPKRQMERRDELLAALGRAFDDAAAYRAARMAQPDKHPLDVRWEALLPVLRGEMPLIVTADEVQQIESAVAFAAERKLKLILGGGYDAEMCAELLRKHQIPVIIEGTYRLPLRAGDDYDAPFTLPARLHKAGIAYCIAGGGRHATENTRNLPYHAAQAVAFGLDESTALRAITLAPAQILGVADRVGSLEKGKDATLFVASGDILETETQVERAWIQGRQVDLSDRQKKLRDKYEQKYK